MTKTKTISSFPFLSPSFLFSLPFCLFCSHPPTKEDPRELLHSTIKGNQCWQKVDWKATKLREKNMDDVINLNCSFFPLTFVHVSSKLSGLQKLDPSASRETSSPLISFFFAWEGAHEGILHKKRHFFPCPVRPYFPSQLGPWAGLACLDHAVARPTGKDNKNSWKSRRQIT